jgi:predicted SprT family Zn-dependent metalloprotease
MKIPKRFKLLGHTIEVEENDTLVHERNWNGSACYEEMKIELLPITKQHPKAITKYEQVFCHELAHFLIYYSGAVVNHHFDGKYLHQNEEFIDLLGSLIHQTLSTMEYEEDKC